jgi:trehalose utilization protein
MTQPIRVTVWNENRHEQQHKAVQKIYPDGIHQVIADHLNKQDGIEATTAWLDKDKEHGLSEKVLEHTDVLTWWGHMAHDEVKDEIAQRVQKRILQGMGFIPMHSAHLAKPFRLILGTNCSLRWREAAERERLWNIEPAHPITQGIGEYIELPETEMYGERFDIPTPDKIIFISWFQGGEVFRSGCCWERGHGKIFYFHPGHETHPIYYNEEIMQVITNAVRWAAPIVQLKSVGDCPNIKNPIEKLK